MKAEHNEDHPATYVVSSCWIFVSFSQWEEKKA